MILESLRFVAGYVLYSRKNSIKNSDQYLPKAMGGKSNMGCSNSVTFLEYTRYWVKKVSCGGLICVTNRFYKFIRKVEYTVQEVLNMKLIVDYAGENLRNVLLEKVKENKDIHKDWELLTSKTCSKIKVKF